MATDGQTGGIATLSVEEILALEQKVRANKAASLKGEPPPFEVTPEMLNQALMSIRAQRGTLELTKNAEGGSSKKGGVAAKIELLDLDGL